MSPDELRLWCDPQSWALRAQRWENGNGLQQKGWGSNLTPGCSSMHLEAPIYATPTIQPRAVYIKTVTVYYHQYTAPADLCWVFAFSGGFWFANRTHWYSRGKEKLRSHLDTNAWNKKRGFCAVCQGDPGSTNFNALWYLRTSLVVSHVRSDIWSCL